jgi:hypothetical protein
MCLRMISLAAAASPGAKAASMLLSGDRAPLLLQD